VTGGEGGIIGSISRSKIADDDECLFVCKLLKLRIIWENIHRGRG
jgi:hypothetical protein